MVDGGIRSRRLLVLVGVWHLSLFQQLNRSVVVFAFLGAVEDVPLFFFVAVIQQKVHHGGHLPVSTLTLCQGLWDFDYLQCILGITEQCSHHQVMASYRKTSHYPISRPIPLICQSLDLTPSQPVWPCSVGFWWFSRGRAAMCSVVKAWSLSLFKGYLSSCSILRLTLSNIQER